MTRLHLGIAAFALSLQLASLPAAAQTPARVTEADIVRLQDNVYLAERDLSDLRARDASRAARLQGELDDLRDEVIYLKVKLRKERTLASSEYADVRDRIDGLRSRARTSGADTTSSTATPRSTAPTVSPDVERPAPASSAGSGSVPPARGTSGREARAAIPAGTELDVRLLDSLNSGMVKVEDRFEAATIVDLTEDGRTLVPAGSVIRGVVSAVEPASRTNRTARMTLSFDELTIGERTYEIRGTVTEAIEGEGIKGEAGRIGAGAGVGAIIGGILGGFKGAMAGILIGGGGVIAATEGKEVELPQGTVLRVRLETGVGNGVWSPF